MEITDEELLGEAQALALYVRFADRRIAELEAALTALGNAEDHESSATGPNLGDLGIQPATTDRMRESIRLSWQWEDRGPIGLTNGQLVFPDTPKIPAVYRLLFAGSEHDAYVGETVNLRQRMARYRTPHATQKTNTRVNALLVDAINQGATITLQTVTEAVIALSAGVREGGEADLGTMAVRVLIERAAEASSRRAGYNLINK